MPSSRPNHIPIVLSVVRQLQPASILDIGVGFGKWGHLFREYTDIAQSENDPARYQRANWRVRIDGIEGHAAYLTPAHAYLYNTIFVGDMRTQILRAGDYDLIFLGDCLEHLDHADGEALLRACRVRARKAVLVTTPARPVQQSAVCGNPLEQHRSFWRPRDFRRIGRCAIRVDDNDTLIAVFPTGDRPAPRLEPERRRTPAVARWLQRLRALAGSVGRPSPGGAAE